MLGFNNAAKKERTILKQAAAYEINDQDSAREQFIEQSAAEAATTKEYADWVEKYLKTGGEISAIYAGNMDNEVLVARRSAPLPPLYSGGVHVIIPKGVSITKSPYVYGSGFDGWGHSKLYMRDGSVTSGTGAYVALYKDTVTELKRRGYSLNDLKNRYTGPDWNRAFDMKALKDAFLGRAALPAPVPQKPAAPAMDPQLSAAIRALGATAPRP